MKSPAFNQDQFTQRFVYYTLMTLAQKSIMDSIRNELVRLGMTNMDPQKINQAYKVGVEAMVSQWAEWEQKAFNAHLQKMTKKDFTELRMHTGVEDVEQLRVEFKRTLDSVTDDARGMLALEAVSSKEDEKKERSE